MIQVLLANALDSKLNEFTIGRRVFSRIFDNSLEDLRLRESVVVSVGGEAFCKAAELQLALGSKHEGATHYIDAGNCYRKGDAQGKVFLTFVRIIVILSKSTLWASN